MIGRIVWEHVRQRAVNAVKKAVHDGMLPSPVTLTCADCSSPARFYEHRDYQRPLDVVPICAPCNHRRGPASFNPKAWALEIESRDNRGQYAMFRVRELAQHVTKILNEEDAKS